LLITGLIGNIFNNIYTLLIGRFYGATQAGYFVQADRIRLVTSNSMTQVVQSVSYPILSQINNTSTLSNSSNPSNLSNPASPEADFVLLADVCPDIIQEIRYYTTYNFVGERIPGYERPVAYLTHQAADSLKLVCDDLKEQGYRLKVFDAYRPQMAVDFFVRWGSDLDDQRMKEYFYPDCPKSELFHRGYIAHKSGHTRGSTLDLTLFDMKTEREVDMGGTYDFLGETSHYNYSHGLTRDQINHRRILREAMMRHGFKPIAVEWWHFTLRNEPYPDHYFTFPIR
jgi:D-alanyl-D-alanine dipeptidase